MLYERWREVAWARREERALRDVASGQSWTFAKLFADGDAHELREEGIVCPQGHSIEFVLALLAAWRLGRTTCPLEIGQARPELPTTLPESCVHLKWTSGTTEAPKLIAFTAEQLAADAAQIVASMGLRSDWPNVGVISLAHSYGFSNLVLPLLLHGIPLLLAPSPLPEVFRRAVAEESAVTVAAVPAMWRAWHESGGIPAPVRLGLSAGAPLPLPLEQAVFAACGIKLHNFYGASECGGIAYDSSATPRPDAGLAGTVMPGVKLSLSGDGCLVVRSAAVGQGYWPEDSAAFGHGIFHTSDLAELKDGLVFLRGRQGDVINMAGRKVSPESIERALLGHASVRECLVFGAPSGNEERADTIVAVVAGSASEMELKQFLLEALPSWQVPRHWQWVESLTAGPRGKISRAEWRRRFLSGRKTDEK